MKAKRKLKCFYHPNRRAVVIFNQRYPLCGTCNYKVIEAVLTQGERLCIAVKGEPQALLLPISKN